MSKRAYDSIVMTADIDSKIINIVQNTSKYCYIISPSISLWPLLERAFGKCVGSDKKITVIVDNSCDVEQRNIYKKLIEKYGIEVLLVNNLHFSLFFNEKESLFSSMSVYDNSQENNFELGSYSFNPELSANLKIKVIDEELLKFSTKFGIETETQEDPLVKEVESLPESQKKEIDSSLDMNYDNNADEDDSPVDMPW